MFDIGWSELAVLTVVALIFIGPRELPKVLWNMGRWAGKARTAVRGFQDKVDDVVRDAGLEETRKDLNSLRTMKVRRELGKIIDSTGGDIDFLSDSQESKLSAATRQRSAISQTNNCSEGGSNKSTKPEPDV